MSGKIFQAIPKIMMEMDAVGKDRTNEFHKFKYRGIDDVYNALQKVMAANGVFTVPAVLAEQRKEYTSDKGKLGTHAIINYRFDFYAEDGSKVEAFVVGEAMDTGDKSSNKCAAIAHKYALLQVFCIPTEDQKDPDAESHEVAPPSPGPVFNASLPEHKAAANVELSKAKIPAEKWPAIYGWLNGKPFAAISAVIQKARQHEGQE